MNKKIVGFVASLCLTVGLTACAADDTSDGGQPVGNNDSTYVKVYKQTIDGTPCVVAVADRYRGVSVSCDWTHPTTP